LRPAGALVFFEEVGSADTYLLDLRDLQVSERLLLILRNLKDKNSDVAVGGLFSEMLPACSTGTVESGKRAISAVWLAQARAMDDPPKL
jgi:hypothetical protein